jgi:hypothetical protein
MTSERWPKTHKQQEGQQTFAVGHLALGYITGKATSKILNVNVNIPLLFVASVISDIDLLIPSLEHRGPTHSLIVIPLLFIPIFMLYGKRATPYFIALIQHSILGDYPTSGGDGIQLLWPATTQWYGIGFEITSLTNILIEWAFFVTSLTIMHKTKDTWILFQRHPSNLLLSVPVFTILLPILISFPIAVPIELIIPHLAYLTIFSISILIDLKSSPK